MNAEIICATCRHARKSRGLVIACLASCGNIHKRISINLNKQKYETDDKQTFSLQ